MEGERLLQQERYNEAIALFQLATEKIPREARAWNMLGLAYQGAGLASEARSLIFVDHVGEHGRWQRQISTQS